MRKPLCRTKDNLHKKILYEAIEQQKHKKNGYQNKSFPLTSKYVSINKFSKIIPDKPQSKADKPRLITKTFNGVYKQKRVRRSVVNILTAKIATAKTAKIKYPNLIINTSYPLFLYTSTFFPSTAIIIFV